MASELSLGFLGAGKMATALAQGLIKAGLASPQRVVASDPHGGARSQFAEATGAVVTTANAQVVEETQVLFLAVKPGQVAELLSEVRPFVQPHHLVISIAAGIKLEQLESLLPEGTRVVRVMPNTPALVGAGASGYSLGTSATKDDGALTAKLLGAVGIACEVKEPLLDAVTGLSGSGPAYGFVMIEALSDGAVAAGLPRDIATRLAAQTLLGAAKMVLETGMHPGALKDMVCSPGGTTIEAVHELEKAGVRAGLMNAVRAASEKSKKLGQ